MELKEITIDDIESQKEVLFLAMWKPEDEKQYSYEIMEEKHVKDYYEHWLKDSNDIGLFAMDGDTVAGLAQLRKKRSPTVRFADIPELVIAVKPEYQKKGVATRLILELIKRNPARGIRLNVHPKNKRAIKLYKNLGFETYYVDENGFISMILIQKEYSFFI